MDGVVPDVEEIMKHRTDEMLLEKLTMPPQQIVKMVRIEMDTAHD